VSSKTDIALAMNEIEIYLLRSRLFTYDIMKNFNCNISLWFFSHLNSHFLVEFMLLDL
jgi:hypothetical protein